MQTNIDKIAAYGTWAIAWASVFGSLYFSEIEKMPPCDLCWWQRILMYPLALITTTAILRKDFKTLAYYVVPFGVLGSIVALYHSLLQWGIIEHNVLDCSVSSGVSCSDPEVIFWFVTIPFASFLGFAAITVLSLASIFSSKIFVKSAKK